MTNIELGKYLNSVRCNLNLSTYDVNRLCDISQSYLSLIENGKRKPSALVLKKLSSIYNLDCIELYKKCGYLDFSDETTKNLKNKLKSLSSEMKKSDINTIGMLPIYSSPFYLNEEPLGYIPVDCKMYGIKDLDDYYFLKNTDNSINKLVKSNSFLLIKKQTIALNNDIIVLSSSPSKFSIKKHIILRNNIILLESLSSDNSDETIYIDKNKQKLKILGKVISYMCNI